MNKLLKFSRSYWEMAKACGGAKDDVLRNYDIQKEYASGKSMGQLSIKYSISKAAISKIINDK